jgi:hypothetical protein
MYKRDNDVNMQRILDNTSYITQLQESVTMVSQFQLDMKEAVNKVIGKMNQQDKERLDTN